MVRVRRAIGTGPGGKRYEKEPKSRAGVRDQRIPDGVGRALAEHLRTYVTGRDGLLFPGPSGDWLQPTRFRDVAGGWREVREAVGRPINFHDLRATGATRLAQNGAHVAGAGLPRRLLVPGRRAVRPRDAESDGRPDRGRARGAGLLNPLPRAKAPTSHGC